MLRRAYIHRPFLSEGSSLISYTVHFITKVAHAVCGLNIIDASRVSYMLQTKLDKHRKQHYRR